MNTTTHCIHPDFLQNQIKRSLKRLNRKWLDGFLIHNPEYYLKSELSEVKKEVYYSRIKQSFELLEELADKGMISYYGVSSNTLSVHDHSPCTSLNELLRISTEVASKNRFRLIQFPFNLFEYQPISEHNGNGNLISSARQNNLITFSNRPLNCHTPQGFIRLAQYDAISDDQLIAAETAHNKFIGLIAKKLRELGLDDNPLEFEIIAYRNKNWKTIGNHGAVERLFAEYLRRFLNNFYQDSIPEKDFISPNMPTTERNVILSFMRHVKILHSSHVKKMR